MLMHVVIEIDEKDYELMKYTTVKSGAKRDGEYMRNLILNGKPLPKNHGRLIDEQQIIDRFKPIEKFKHWRVGTDGLFNVLSDAPTIIEGSDKE